MVMWCQIVVQIVHVKTSQRRDRDEEEVSDSESVAVAVPRSVKKATVTSKW